MKTGNIIHGFEITNKRYSEELKGTLYEMKHKRTHAELVFLDNKSDNKLFSVAFRTLPRDDTGVFHILEHSVLAGSENYPVKEPFLDLLKSSMNTFLNAMTFPDKTVYPVSSRNEQDFINLVSVYLDAVFKPAIYNNESIFRQEGWHYELDEDKNPFYNGVVFNEMKGALSSVDGLIEKETMKNLFPDSIYGFESGGDPKAIPDLTYENFLSAHREFYSPSNAKFYLDGDVPLDRVLALIDGKYLSEMDFCEKHHEIKMQKPIQTTDIDCFYEIGKNEDEDNKTQFVLARVFTDWSDRKRIMAYSLISSYLTGSNESPLKRAVLEKGLAQDVEFSIQDGIAQPFYLITFRNSEKDKKDEILDLYKKTLKKIIDEGIDKDELNASINQFEFALKETEEPSGLVRNINMLSSLLYGGDALLYLENDSLMKELRQAVDTDYYKDILSELYSLEGNLIMRALPSKTKGDLEREAEEARVKSEYNSFTDEEKEKVKETYDRMRLWQDTPDSPEAKATLPVLSVSDVKKEAMWTDTEVINTGSVKTLFHKINTNGIIHANLFFDISDESEENISALSVLANLLSVLPTENYSSVELHKEIKKSIGYLDFNVENVMVKDKPLETKIFFTVGMSVLKQDIGRAVELIEEILLRTDFNRKEIIKENILQIKEELYQSVMTSGNAYGRKRVLMNTAANAFVDEKSGGYSLLEYLNGFSTDTDQKEESFISFVSSRTKEIFTSSRLTIGETGEEHSKTLEKVCDFLPEGNFEKCVFEIEKREKKKEAILIPSGISYAVSGMNINDIGFRYDGILTVTSMLLTFGYLWNEIRVHGGAYGCGFRSAVSGNTTFHSYRDPNPLNSLRVYSETSSFIKDFVSSDEGIERYIISSIAATEALMSTAKQGYNADINFLANITKQDKQAIRDRMLSLKKEDLLEICDMFDRMSEKGSVCIIGNENALSSIDDSWTVYRL